MACIVIAETSRPKQRLCVKVVWAGTEGSLGRKQRGQVIDMALYSYGLKSYGLYSYGLGREQHRQASSAGMEVTVAV